MHADSFSRWHRCRRWTEKGMECAFSRLEAKEEEKRDSEEDVDAKPSNVHAREGVATTESLLSAAVGKEAGGMGFGDALGFLGPILALFTILRAIQTMEGLPIGNITKAGFAEEATTRVLRPRVPAKEGPKPSRPTTPARVPVGITRAPQPMPRAGGGGGFFKNQALELQKMIRGR